MHTCHSGNSGENLLRPEIWKKSKFQSHIHHCDLGKPPRFPMWPWARHFSSEPLSCDKWHRFCLASLSQLGEKSEDTMDEKNLEAWSPGQMQYRQQLQPPLCWLLVETEARTVLPLIQTGAGGSPPCPIHVAHISLRGHLPLTHKLSADLTGEGAAKHLSSSLIWCGSCSWAPNCFLSHWPALWYFNSKMCRWILHKTKPVLKSTLKAALRKWPS